MQRAAFSREPGAWPVEGKEESERRRERKKGRRGTYTLDISLNHSSHELVEGNLTLPSENALRLGGSTVKELNLRRTEVPLVNPDQDATGLRALSNLVDGVALALPGDGGANDGEGLLDELADGVGLTGGKDEVVGGVLLEHAPHTLDVVLGVSPVALGVEVTEVLREGREVSFQRERKGEGRNGRGCPAVRARSQQQRGRSCE